MNGETMRTILLLLTTLLATTAGAGSYALRLESPAPGRLQAITFLVDGRVEAEIEAVGVRYKYVDEDFVTAWLLHHDSGEAVWRLAAWDARPVGSSRLLRKRKDTLELEPGVYTLYQYSGAAWRSDPRFRSWGSFMQDLADMLNRENPVEADSEHLDACFAQVRVLSGPALREIDGVEEEIYPVRLTRLMPGTVRTAGFRLRDAAPVQVRVVGERGSRDDSLYDYGWIEDAESGETVWVSDIADARPAGGSPRNVAWSEEVRLPAGVFRAGFLCDDSHGWNDWNAPPPLDPASWGLSLLAAPGVLEALTPEETPEAPDCLVRWVRVGDGAQLRREFTLTDDTSLRILCLGEGRRREMFDYGVIVDLDSGREVWGLEYDNASKAGGGSKNLVFDDVIRLPAGRYRAAYFTDGSHASGSWNDAPPTRAHEYGLTIRVIR